MFTSYIATGILLSSALCAAVPFNPRANNGKLPRTLQTRSSNSIQLGRREVNNTLRKRADGSSDLTIFGSWGGEWTAPVTIGGQTLDIVIDTNGDETWVPAKGFQCLDANLNVLADPTKGYCPAEQNLYTPSTTLQLIQGSPGVFNLNSGDIVGQWGYETLEVAGIPIPHQRIGVVNKGYFSWEDNAIGWMGLGQYNQAFDYSKAAAAADGSDGITDSTTVFETLSDREIISPWFSLAVSRTNNNPSVLTLGAQPAQSKGLSWSGGRDDQWTKAPLIPWVNDVYWAYYIVIDGLVYAAADDTSFVKKNNILPVNTIVPATVNVADKERRFSVASAYPGLDVQTADYTAINALFSPPADASGNVNCNAVPPTVGVQIDGIVFWIDPRDLISTTSDGTCRSEVFNAGTGSNTLGGAFLKNVVSIFNRGKSDTLTPAMYFASRDAY